jgi:hypothetical protein
MCGMGPYRDPIGQSMIVTVIGETTSRKRLDYIGAHRPGEVNHPLM